MDEKPEDHDFDQRHDGPFDQPHPSATLPLRQVSEPAITPAQRASSNPTEPSTRPRKSVQLPRQSEDVKRTVGRKSTQLERKSFQTDRARRTSRDFDVRRDGPFGRPSITMVRRRSSIAALPPMPGTTAAQDSEHPEDVDPTAPSVEALMGMDSVEPGFEPEPPALNYSLWDRKWAIVFFWSLIVVDCIAMPIVLYFTLWYLTDLSHNAVFSIVTAALGGVSIFEYFVRFWRLWKHSSTCRVIGARRAYLDWFHWNFSLGWGIIMIELIVGTVPANPPIRLLAMPITSMLYCFGTELLVIDTLRYFEVPAPCRISSIPKGAQLRPGIYSIIEDVCAVDGSGGTAFREALNKRYEASHVFRAMLRRLGAFWAFGAEGIAVVTTILIFTIQHEAAYVVGWSVPFIWAGVWSLVTYFYVQRKLKEEQKAWSEELAEKSAWVAEPSLQTSTGERPTTQEAPTTAEPSSVPNEAGMTEALSAAEEPSKAEASSTTEAPATKDSTV